MGDASASVDAGVDAGGQAALASVQAGDISGDAVKEAITVGAQVAAVAACTAVGFPELAPLCSLAAAAIIGPIASAMVDFFDGLFGDAGPSIEGTQLRQGAEIVAHFEKLSAENFASLDMATGNLWRAFIASGLPGTYDPFAVLAYLGVELVPTEQWPVLPSRVDRAGRVVRGPPVVGGAPWSAPWMPPDWLGHFSDDGAQIFGASINAAHINTSTQDADKIAAYVDRLSAAVAAWRHSLLAAAMVATVQIGTEAAAVETARQIEALAQAKREADARGQLLDVAALLDLGATIAATRATLTAYGRGVTNGVTFLRTVPPRPAAEGLAALNA